MRQMLINLGLLFVGLTTSSLPTFACTDFKLTAKDGSVMITRSMEFGLQLNSAIRNSNRGRTFTSNTPNNKPGHSWKATYGYIFVNGLNQDFVTDGMNEQGLSFGYLYLPGLTQYQAVPAGKDNQAIPYYQLGDWVLSNFKTVEEVRQALASLYVFEQGLPAMPTMIFPLHASIYDSTGKGIIVEFTEGKMNIYDSIGVLTNSPSYGWQVTNLRNYLTLSPYAPNPVTVNGITYSATGQGSGAFGLPGDVAPPSRFAKMSYFTKVAYPANDASELLNLSQHFINNVDIPAGLARARNPSGKESTESTQWVVFKDLVHKMFYYRTYGDMSLRSISLDKIDFSEKAPRFNLPMEQAPQIMDVTQPFLNSKLTQEVSNDAAQ